MRLTNYAHLIFNGNYNNNNNKLYVMSGCQVSTAKSQNTQFDWRELEQNGKRREK